MSKEILTVNDLYEGAYLMCNGCELSGVTKTIVRNRERINFIFKGSEIKTKSEAYKCGQATANVALLKFTMIKLKDKMLNY